MLTNTRSYSLFFALTLILAAPAMAQHYQPFADSEIHYDLQLFAPPIVEEYGNDPVAPNYGFFFQYSRVYMNLTRPDYVQSDFDGDWTWGNRIDAGYMTEENHGWSLTTWHINRTQIFEFTDTFDIFGDDVLLANSLNDGRYSGVELNKTFRLKPIQHGDNFSFFEPFFGVRWGCFEDNYLIETLTLNQIVLPTLQNFSSISGEFENNMIGLQLGSRWYTRRGHWVVAGEFRGFGQQNFQFLTQNNTTQQTVFIPDDPADPTVGDFFVGNPVIVSIDRDYSEFVVGGELRLEAAYELTREIRARVGFNIMHFGTGIGRGPILANLVDNDQDVTYAGVVFGIDINR